MVFPNLERSKLIDILRDSLINLIKLQKTLTCIRRLISYAKNIEGVFSALIVSIIASMMIQLK